MVPESVSKLLGESAELRPLQERLDLIKRLQRRYRTLVPEELAAASRVGAIDGTTVVVCAASGPVAAALKQIAPRLLVGLRGKSRNSLKQNENQEITGIRIEVQVAVRPIRRAVLPRGDLPVERLAKLAEGLSDSPLKATLVRIAHAPQIKRSREKT
jgi:hypothetical protein